MSVSVRLEFKSFNYLSLPALRPIYDVQQHAKHFLIPQYSQPVHKCNIIQNNYTKVRDILELCSYDSATIYETVCEVILASLS